MKEPGEKKHVPSLTEKYYKYLRRVAAPVM
jgi:hypothetical protein